MENRWYTKEETVKELCEVVTQVGEHFDHQYSHDCICGENPAGSRVDSHVIGFIKEAVKEKIES